MYKKYFNVNIQKVQDILLEDWKIGLTEPIEKISLLAKNYNNHMNHLKPDFFMFQLQMIKLHILTKNISAINS